MRQTPAAAMETETCDKDDNSHNSADEEDADEQPAKRARRHVQVAKPTQLQFYPSCWTSVLEYGKNLNRLYVGTDVPFQDENQQPHKDHAQNLLDEAMAFSRDEGKMVESGLLNFPITICTLPNRRTGYYPEHQADMCTLVSLA
jgi:hypothetical protein